MGLQGVARFLKNSAPYLINIYYRLLCGTLHLLQCIVLIFICISYVGSCSVGSCSVGGTDKKNTNKIMLVFVSKQVGSSTL